MKGPPEEKRRYEKQREGNITKKTIQVITNPTHANSIQFNSIQSNPIQSNPIQPKNEPRDQQQEERQAFQTISPLPHCKPLALPSFLPAKNNNKQQQTAQINNNKSTQYKQRESSALKKNAKDE
ncbi:MAG TPA: hypothetical protein V6C97_03520 [Oculatellaceae cyanobacterium]